MSRAKARLSASALFICRVSTRQTSLRTWCQHSMPHRNPYHRTMRRAVLGESISQSLKSTQSMGSAPLGGLVSVAISAHNGVVPQLFLHPTRGGLILSLIHISEP